MLLFLYIRQKINIISCIKSVLNQSYPNIEIILIDDGSDDESFKKCQLYANKFDNIFFFRQSNKGASSARNVGIAHANGKYMYFMDSDDLMLKDCISTAVTAIEKGYQLVFFDYYTNDISVGANNASSLITENLNKIDGIKSVLDVQVSNIKVNGYLWNKLFVSSIIKKNNLEFNTKFKMWEDLLFCSKYILLIDKIIYVNKKLYIYKNDNHNSISRSLSTESAYSWVKAGQAVGKIVSKYFPEQYAGFTSHLVNIYMTYLITAIKNEDVINDSESIVNFIKCNKLKLRIKYKIIFVCLCLNCRISSYLIRKYDL